MKRRQRRPRFSSLSSFIQKEDKEDKEENLSSVYKPWLRLIKPSPFHRTEVLSKEAMCHVIPIKQNDFPTPRY